MVTRNPSDLIGVGVYSISDAARLISADTRSIDRWMFSRQSKHKDRIRTSKPIFRSTFDTDSKQKLLSFRDLIELKIIRLFYNAGVSFRELRKAHGKASEILKTSHPFSTKRFKDFKTDGTRIYLSDDESILTLSEDQFNLPAIVRNFFIDIDYSEEDEPQRWYPSIGEKHVVLDPERRFGQPIINEAGIPTIALYNAYKAEENNVDSVAFWYAIRSEFVKLAVKYEESLLNK